ncbi:MAG: plastocyanin/azurin family copper-binding protein [Balneolaceae bacterium]
MSDSFHRHALFVFLIGLLLLTLAACGGGPTDSNTGGNGGGGNGGGDEPAENEVIMTGTTFTPSSIQIEVGETVTWRNQSSMTHTVTSGSNRQHDDEFNSGNLAPGADYSVTFTEAGDFDYFCIPHVGMNGSVTVIDPTAESVQQGTGEHGRVSP